jgi:hypothetical protein
MGKGGQAPRLITAWPEAPPDGPVVLCPCVAGLPEALVAELAILPIHDANAALLRILPDAPPACGPDFAGLCLTDPFIRLDDVFERLHRAGIRGVANFPTVCVLIGAEEDSQITRLHRRELLGLDRARDAGFGILRIGPEDEPGSLGYRALSTRAPGPPPTVGPHPAA